MPYNYMKETKKSIKKSFWYFIKRWVNYHAFILLETPVVTKLMLALHNMLCKISDKRHLLPQMKFLIHCLFRNTLFNLSSNIFTKHNPKAFLLFKWFTRSISIIIVPIPLIRAIVNLLCYGKKRILILNENNH